MTQPGPNSSEPVAGDASDLEDNPARGNRWRWVSLVAGPLAGAIVYLLLRTGVQEPGAGAAPVPGLTHAGLLTLCVGAWMAVWWLTEPVSSAVTALLPVLLFPLLGVMGFKQAAAPYADELIVLFFCGFVLAIALEKHAIHTRVALWTVRGFGTRPSLVILGVMIATGAVSMWVSNTATAVMMMPIAMSLAAMAEGGQSHAGPKWTDAARRNFGRALLLGVAYGSSIGGMGTPIGTPPNLQLSAYAAEVLDRPIGFGQWMVVAMPVVVITLPVAWLILLLMHPFARTRGLRLAGERGQLKERLRSLGRMGPSQWMVIAVFVLAAACWTLRTPVTALFNSAATESHAAAVEAWQARGADPSARPAAPKRIELISDAGIGLVAAMALFTIPCRRKGEMFVVVWRDCARLPWGTLFLFGGGLSLAAALRASGADGYLGGLFQHLQGLPTPVFLILLAGGIIALSEIASNTALAATVIPVLGSAAPSLGMDALPLLMVATLAASSGFALPVATPPNAIAYATGRLPLGAMVRSGVALDAVCALVITVMFWLLGPTLLAFAGLAR